MKIAFLTGAGISADSNIPTFQEQKGIRNKLTRNFATAYPEEHAKVINKMKDICDKAEPNIAHKTIAEYGYQVITMNVDGLHTRAGSKNVVEVHGNFDDGIILYGDSAPMYETAYQIVEQVECLVIVGTSFRTGISEQLYRLAKDVIIINESASEEVPIVCEELRLKYGE